MASAEREDRGEIPEEGAVAAAAGSQSRWEELLEVKPPPDRGAVRTYSGTVGGGGTIMMIDKNREGSAPGVGFG